MKTREDRRHNVGNSDQRDAFQKDRDRIAYSSAFHRLAGITQVVRADEEDIFHTRQQHSFKVAQVGRRLAQKIFQDTDKSRIPTLENNLHVEVVEAACLAHDLGHPPFGHAAEKVLNDKLTTDHDNPDGFEGNAQTFRVLTKLSVRFDSEDCDGLDLTRATLNACLKYPWKRDLSDPKKKTKWCAYASEMEDFCFARGLTPEGSEAKSLEAQIMDWADDIAYSVHDLEDFHRCGVIPWQRVLYEQHERQHILDCAKEAWFEAPADAEDRLSDAFKNLEYGVFALYKKLISTQYQGSRSQRQELRSMTSQLVSVLVRSTTICWEDEGPRLDIEPFAQDWVRVLKQITRDYIISNPSLAAQQRGQTRIINSLFDEIFQEYRPGHVPAFLPIRMRYLDDHSESNRARFAADCICALTEREATELYARIFGTSSGSVLNPIVR